jgi:hypothetical protein
MPACNPRSRECLAVKGSDLKQILLVATLAAVQLYAQPFSRVQGGDVWLTRDIQWEKVPRNYNPHLSTGLATILYFRADGRFGMMRCRVNRGLTI